MELQELKKMYTWRVENDASVKQTAEHFGKNVKTLSNAFFANGMKKKRGLKKRRPYKKQTIQPSFELQVPIATVGHDFVAVVLARPNQLKQILDQV